MGKKIPSEFVKQEHWDSSTIGITNTSAIKFPAKLIPLKNDLKEFLINLLKQIYPNKETVSASKQGLKTRNMKTIKTATETSGDQKSQNINKRPSPPSQSPKIKNHQSSGKQPIISKTNEENVGDKKSQNTNKRPSPPSQSPKIKNQSPGKQPVISETNEENVGDKKLQSTNNRPLSPNKIPVIKKIVPKKSAEVQPLENMKTPLNFNPPQKSIEVQPPKNMKTPPNFPEQANRIVPQKSIKVQQMKSMKTPPKFPEQANRIALQKSIKGQQMKSTNLSEQTSPGKGKPFNLEKWMMGQNFSDFNVGINDIIDKYIQSAMNNMDDMNNEKKLTIFSKVMDKCEKKITTLKNTISKFNSTQLDATESECINNIKDCLTDFLNNLQVFEGELNTNAPILVLYKQLTGKGPTIEDITKSFGNPKDSEAISSMKKSDDDKLNKSFKNCLAALMRVYNVKGNINRYLKLGENMGEGSFGAVQSITLSEKNKEKVFKFFKDDKDNSQERIERDIHTNKSLHNQHSRMKNEEKALQEEINDLESQLKSLQNQTRSNDTDVTLNEKIEALNNEIKEKKLEKEESALARNLVINPKTIGRGIETKKGEMDLVGFFEKLETDEQWTNNATIEQLAQNMIDSVNFYHTKFKRIHYDIKPDNFIVFQKGKAREGTRSPYVCKLCDPDFTTKINKKYTFKCKGTPEFMPKVFCDVKSVGEEKELDIKYDTIELCENKVKGINGAKLGIAQDNYALYLSLHSIKKYLSGFQKFSDSCNFIDSKIKELEYKNGQFAMFNSTEGLKKFLIKNGIDLS